jgi:hypothetical protein
MGELVTALHMYTAAHEALSRTEFAKLYSCSEGCRLKALFELDRIAMLLFSEPVTLHFLSQMAWSRELPSQIERLPRPKYKISVHEHQVDLRISADHEQILHLARQALHVRSMRASRNRGQREDIRSSTQSSRAYVPSTQQATQATIDDGHSLSQVQEQPRKRLYDDFRVKEKSAAIPSLPTRAGNQFEADSADEDEGMENEIDANHNGLSGVMDRLNRLARSNGQEVDQQNQYIGPLTQKSDRVDDQIALSK